MWSPDGAFLAFASDRTPHSSIYRKPVHGNDEESLVVSGDENVFPLDYAKDGSSLLYHQDNSAQHTIGIWLKPLTGSSTAREVASNSFDQRDGRLSPDGKFVTYVSNESGTDEVYVKPQDGSAKVRVSMAGGDILSGARTEENSSTERCRRADGRNSRQGRRSRGRKPTCIVSEPVRGAQSARQTRARTMFRPMANGLCSPAGLQGTRSRRLPCRSDGSEC